MAVYLGLGFGGSFIVVPGCYNRGEGLTDDRQIPIYMLAGGLLYSGGVYFFLQNDQPMLHVIWHMFVFAAAIVHYLGLEMLVKVANNRADVKAGRLNTAKQLPSELTPDGATLVNALATMLKAQATHTETVGTSGTARTLLASPYAHNDFWN